MSYFLLDYFKDLIPMLSHDELKDLRENYFQKMAYEIIAELTVGLHNTNEVEWSLFKYVKVRFKERF